MTTLEFQGPLIIEHRGLVSPRLHMPVNGVSVNNSLCDSCSLQASCVEQLYPDKACNAYATGRRYYDITPMIPHIKDVLP